MRTINPSLRRKKEGVQMMEVEVEAEAVATTMDKVN